MKKSAREKGHNNIKKATRDRRQRHQESDQGKHEAASRKRLEKGGSAIKNRPEKGHAAWSIKKSTRDRRQQKKEAGA